ncbi:hypothetical protein ON010_g5886 [Phytophthora cinnamomi]|nr:hypothetical protein ON010_g5886 [Phytophthora cinnamomi]
MGKAWDADAASPGSPTSMDVLHRWLRTPGNYKRWQTQARKLLVEEILAELQMEGTSTRSPSSIRHKIFRLQHQYETATIWLKNGGYLEQYCNGRAGDHVMKSVLEKCPHYRELAPVFQSRTCSDADINNIADETNVVEKRSDDAEITGVVEEGKPATRSAQGKRKRASKAQGLRTTKRKKGQTPILPALTQVDVAGLERVPDLQTNYPVEKSLALTEFQKRSESRWNEYLGAKTTPGLGDSESQRLLNREMEHADAFAKLRLEAEAKRQELQTICAKAVLRQNLRSSGLSEEEVDSYIPK